MTRSLLILISSGSLLIFILVVRFFEMKSSKYILPFKLRHCGDNFITKILLAVFKNIVKIKKLVMSELYLLPRRLFRLTYKIWFKLKVAIDRFYDKFHK